MKASTVPILIILTTFLIGCSGDKPPLVSPRVCPPYPEMPLAAKMFLGANATVDPDGAGPEPRRPRQGAEEFWDWLSEIAVLRAQLEACRT